MLIPKGFVPSWHFLGAIWAGFIISIHCFSYTLSSLYMKYRIAAISGALEEESPITNMAKKCASLKTSLEIELIDIKYVPLLNVDLYQNQFP